MRILVVRVGAMGDVLHALPAVAALRLALPEAEIGWAIEPRWAPLLSSQDGLKPLVDRVHLVPTKKWKERPFTFETLRELRAVRRELRAVAYDICVDLQGSIRSAVIGRMAAPGRFLGPAAPREDAAKWLYSQRVTASGEHVIGQACELLSAAVELPLQPAPVQLPFEPDAEAWCAATFARAGDGPVVLLAPTAGWGAKQWGAERYAELARRLWSSGYRVLVNATPGRVSAETERIATNGVAHIAAATLPQLVALARRAALVIGGDTGPIHLAAALGTPVVAVFGPTDPRRNGPYFPGSEGNVLVLRDPASATDHSRHSRREHGLGQISVDVVESAALDLLEREDG